MFGLCHVSHRKTPNFALRSLNLSYCWDGETFDWASEIVRIEARRAGKLGQVVNLCIDFLKADVELKLGAFLPFFGTESCLLLLGHEVKQIWWKKLVNRCSASPP